MRFRARNPDHVTVISRSAEYAIRSLAYLAAAGDRWVLNREIAGELDLPPQFLTKLLGTLTREGLLASQRGRAGGFRLLREPRRITLLAIVDPFDRISSRKTCLLGQATCSDERACPLHESWSVIRDRFSDLLKRTTLSDIIREGKGGAFPASGLSLKKWARPEPARAARAPARGGRQRPPGSPSR